MTTTDFEDAIAELLHQIYSASAQVAEARSGTRTDAIERSRVRLVQSSSEICWLAGTNLCENAGSKAPEHPVKTLKG